MLIISHLMGGLGNQMFQYAIGRQLQLTAPGREFKVYFEDRYKLADRKYCLEAFHTPVGIASSAELSRIGPERRLKRKIMSILSIPMDKYVRREKQAFVFDPEILETTSDVYLVGFWQSYHYFQSIRQQLLEDFRLRQTSDAMMKIKDTITSTQNSVSLHIRRGDYLNPASGFAPLSEVYYRDAIQLTKKNVGNFDTFVFTDDPEWAKVGLGKIADESTTHIVSSPGLMDYEELALMSCCHHNIVANSSFSWWGAWLNTNNQKTVICPRSWNGLDKSIPLKDLIPPDWVPV